MTATVAILFDTQLVTYAGTMKGKKNTLFLSAIPPKSS